MLKLMLILGVILLIVSVPVLVLGLMDTGDGFMTQMIGAVACEPYEELIMETGSRFSSDGFEQNNYYYCEVEPGQRRDVTMTGVLVLMGAFLIPFGLGMLMTMVASWRLARRRVNAFQSHLMSMGTFQQVQPGQTTVIDLRSSSGQIPPETQEVLNKVFGGMFPTAMSGQSNTSLSGRLKQLEDAYENDLITKEEYDKVRQAILDSMDD